MKHLKAMSSTAPVRAEQAPTSAKIDFAISMIEAFAPLLELKSS